LTDKISYQFSQASCTPTRLPIDIGTEECCLNDSGERNEKIIFYKNMLERLKKIAEALKKQPEQPYVPATRSQIVNLELYINGIVREEATLGTITQAQANEATARMMGTLASGARVRTPTLTR
jgi:hypothetical protein